MARRSASPLVAAAAVIAIAACADRVPVTPVAPDVLSAARGDPAPAPEPGRYLVGFNGTPAIAPDVLAESGGRIVDEIAAFNVLVVDGVTNPDALRRANPAYIEAEFEATVDPILGEPVLDGPMEVPGQLNTPWYASGVQWDMRSMQADAAWTMTSGGEGIRICVVDTGVDSNHQELNGGKVVMRANFVAGESRFDDPNGHGSHVSGEAAGRGVVVSGVAPRASVMGARVLNTAGSGSETAIVNGINWCVSNGAHVINMSLGGIRYRGTAAYVNSPIVYGAAIKNATDNGVVVVVSAGNSNIQLPNPGLSVMPAQVPGTIIVGATGPLTRSTAPAAPDWNPFNANHVWRSPDNKAYYSNFGTGVHVFAPGGRGNIPLSEPYRFFNGVGQGGSNDQIWSVCSSQTTQTGNVNSGGVPGTAGSCLNNPARYIAYAGTSMAGPHVAGMAAVLYGELGGARSAASRARVEKCIKSTTDKIGAASTYGDGRVNVKKAVEAMRASKC